MTSAGGGFAVGELDSVARGLTGAGDAVHGASDALYWHDVPSARTSCQYRRHPRPHSQLITHNRSVDPSWVTVDHPSRTERWLG